MLTLNRHHPLKITEISLPRINQKQKLSLFFSPVQAGFPSPAENHVEKRLDINDLVIHHPTATFFVKVEGESMSGANIHSGDILVVDRSIEVTTGQVVVAIVEGEFTVKRYVKEKTGAYLAPENPRYPKFKIDAEADFQIWGVVTYVIHKQK